MTAGVDWDYDETASDIAEGLELTDATTGLALHYGPGRWEVYAFWGPNNAAPPSGRIGLVIYIHGGGVNSPYPNDGNAGYIPPAGMGSTASFERYTKDMNMGLMSIEFSPGRMASDRQQYMEAGFFPTQVEQAFRAVQFAREHADDTSMWGGYQLDRDRITVEGTSQGAVIALLLGLYGQVWNRRPDALDGPWHSATNVGDLTSGYYSGVPDGIIAHVPLVDFTQAGGTVGQAATLWFGMLLGGDVDKVQASRLRAASAWWWLEGIRTGKVKGLRKIPLLCLWDDLSDSGWTWNPGTPHAGMVTSHEDKPQAAEFAQQLLRCGWVGELSATSTTQVHAGAGDESIGMQPTPVSDPDVREAWLELNNLHTA